MTRKQKKILYRIIIAFILLVVGYIIPSENILRLVVFLVSYIIIGYDVFISAVKNIFAGQLLDEQFLMVIATIGAFAIKQYPEGVAVMLFYQIGELFQKIAVGKSRKSISSLMDISPEYAIVLREGEEVEVDPNEVEVGETIVIKAGERIPLDGVIIEGSTTVDSSTITGESLPQSLEVGDEVVSSCINLNGVIKVKVSSNFSESTVSKILELVENSSLKKAKSENFIKKFAHYYTPIVVILAVFIATIPAMFFSQSWSDSLQRGLIFLVVSCPCAMVISVPLSFFCAIGNASRYGILVKGSNYLETLADVDTVVFDKTGTLTKGNFKVVEIVPNEISKGELLQYCAMVESNSTHPIARSIVEFYSQHVDNANTFDKNRLSNIKEFTGNGITADIDGKTIYVGNEKFMKQIGITYEKCNRTGSVVYVAQNGSVAQDGSQSKKYLGHVVVSDEIKDTAKETISQLKKLSIHKTVMLTGDMESVAKNVSQQIGIDEYYSGLLPKDKVDILEQLLQNKNKRVAFVGDGMNDAAALSRSDIGISMGSIGSDVAIEASDIVIMDDDPYKIAIAIKIARKTLRIVKENIWVSIFVKILVLILGTFGIANIWLAIFADVGMMILAILNSIQLGVRS